MNGPVEEQVRQLVKEIRGHETERNVIVARDDFVEWEVQAARVQAEIFRKFAIIDAVKSWNDVTDDVLPGEGEGGAGEVRELKDLVSNAGKETKAEAVDLKLMRIPRLGLRALLMIRGELDYFPKYLELPEVARKIILGVLTSTWDKINVIKAMPFEGELMNWNETNLQFDMIFPIMMAQNILDTVDIRGAFSGSLQVFVCR